MFFTKFPYPANFVFNPSPPSSDGMLSIGKRTVSSSIRSFAGGIHNLTLSDLASWPSNRSLVPLTPPAPAPDGLRWAPDGSLEVLGPDGEVWISTVPGEGIGLNGKASLFQFAVHPDCRYFGMGEKNYGELELSGYRACFWNTDVWSDFHSAQWGDKPTDPSYFSTPYVAVRTPRGWVGILLHNPSPAFIETPGRDDSRVFVEWQRTSPHLLIGARDGEPDLWILTADSLGDLTAKLSRLVGTTPRPPIWALGYHQSRWGYGGHKDLVALDKKFNKAQIPCSGLWLDLDYMSGYRIFTVDSNMFPQGPSNTAALLAQSGRRIVPIIDPGVKREAGYSVYDSGLSLGAFCQNREGTEYVGVVWPGDTVFPDFTLKKARDWFSEHVSRFRKQGFGACWVDMNDPSTGPADPEDMLFENGARSHAEHRNQYALGMQMATHAGFLDAFPDERPFMLSRSGFVGTSRYSAVWTGDNCSNDFYLGLSVTTLLGMALSGTPFAGADVGGFGGDSGDALMTRWIQAAFLTPFMRNHTTLDTRLQEPFSYPAPVAKVLAHFIRLRYRFLPYLYSLFARQENEGVPVYRPLVHDFDDVALDEVGDEAMVGDMLLHAPVLSAQGRGRMVTLPGKDPWFDLASGTWSEPGVRKVTVRRQESPLFIRSGGLVPIQDRLPMTNDVDLLRPTVLVAVPEGWTGRSSLTYFADDGISYAYRKGGQSVVQFHVIADKDEVQLRTEVHETGFGDVVPTFALVARPKSVMVDGQEARLDETVEVFTGRPITVQMVAKG